MKKNLKIKEAEFDSIVKPFTHSAYISAPRDFIGRRVHVIVLPDETKN